MKLENKVEMPRFASEAEEAQWWFDHREETAGLMEQAVSEGRTTSLDAVLGKNRNGGSTPTVSIRIDPSDLARARVQAQKRGLRYQTYLKMVLHEALEREEQTQARF
jgi:predicted DNA binding CopG/RHH family protein